MTWMVEISEETPLPTPGSVSYSTGALIGWGSSVPSLGGTDVNPVHVFSAAELSNVYGVSTGDTVYKSASAFFQSGGTDLWVYVFTSADSQSSKTDIKLRKVGVDSSGHDVYSTGFAPLVSVDAVYRNVYDNGTWTKTTLVEDDAGANDYDVDLENGNVIYLSATEVNSPNYLSADVTVNGIVDVMNKLASPDYVFSGFCFAYDQSLNPSSATGLSDANFRYASSRTYSGGGWYDDFLIGVKNAQLYRNVYKNVIFYSTFPDGVSLGDSLVVGGTPIYISDSSSTLTFGDITWNEYSKMHGIFNQPTTGVDFSPYIMGLDLKTHPRRSAKYLVINDLTLSAYPSMGEMLSYDSRYINSIMRDNFSDGTTFTVTSGNHTYGTGNTGKFNYQRCKGILVNKIIDNIKSALMDPVYPVKYNANGISRIYNVIDAAVEWAVINGYVDGKDEIVIPIKPYVDNEGNLNDSQQAVLDTERATGTVNNIEIRYKWDGDVEAVKISILVGR